MWVQPGITQAQGEVTEYFERVCASKTLGDSNENIDAKLEPDNKLMGYQSQLKIISKKEKVSTPCNGCLSRALYHILFWFT